MPESEYGIAHERGEAFRPRIGEAGLCRTSFYLVNE